MDTFGSVLEGHEDASVGINKSSIAKFVLHFVELKSKTSRASAFVTNQIGAKPAQQPM